MRPIERSLELYSANVERCVEKRLRINANVEQWLAEAEIDGTRRGETLTLEELATLSRILHRMECAGEA